MKHGIRWSVLALLAAAAQAQSPPPPARTYASSPVDTAHGDREAWLLWPDGPPGALGSGPADRPKLTVYRASPKPLNGSLPAHGGAAVVCPGGGYRNLASDHEGRRVAEWLNGLGISVFVLQYRVGPRYRHPIPLMDAQRAMRLVRSRAGELGIDPGRVGIVGFSAGGHLAASVATEPEEPPADARDPVDRLSARPDFMILGYPVIALTGAHAHKGSHDHLLGEAADAGLAARLSADRSVTARTPPAFLFHTADDASVPVENSLAFFRALREAGVPAELHVFPAGRHGVGLAPHDASLSRWPLLAAAWLRSLGVLDAPRQAAPAALDGWRHARELRLDTTPSGAGVAGDVKGFPLLVRLDVDNFDFAQARRDGADVRFTRTDGAILPHEVEHWDAAAKRAAVWVRLDLVKGNDSTQSFRMHWGHASAADVSDSRAVFDSRDGFIGVWHLGDGRGTQDGGYRDATASEAHGTGVNLDAGARADGLAGKAVRLDHARAQWVKIDGEKRRLFDLTTRATVSIWAMARGYLNAGVAGKLPGYETMFAKGDNSWRLQKFGTRSWHRPPTDLIEMCVEGSSPKADLCTVGTTDMVTGRWFHVVAVHDWPRTRFYVNGTLEKDDTFELNWTSGDHPVGIGSQSQFPEQGRHWDGVLDEARVLNVPKDGHWIKLDYESQRPGSKLVVFGDAGRP